MAFKDLCACPAFIPIPQLDQHVVRAGEEEREGGMDGYGADVVCMGFELFDFVHGVVVVDADCHVVGATDDPLFSGDEFSCTDWEVGELK